MQVFLVRRNRQYGNAFVDEFEQVAAIGLAADRALLGVASVDAAGFFGEALADVFGLAAAARRASTSRAAMALGSGGGSVGAEWEDVCT